MFSIIARKFFQTDEWVIRKGFGFGMASESMNDFPLRGGVPPNSVKEKIR